MFQLDTLMNLQNLEKISESLSGEKLSQTLEIVVLTRAHLTLLQLMQT